MNVSYTARQASEVLGIKCSVGYCQNINGKTGLPVEKGTGVNNVVHVRVGNDLKRGKLFRFCGQKLCDKASIKAWKDAADGATVSCTLCLALLDKFAYQNLVGGSG